MNALVQFLRQLVMGTALAGIEPNRREWALTAIYGPGVRWHVTAGPVWFAPDQFQFVECTVRTADTRITRSWERTP